MVDVMPAVVEVEGPAVAFVAVVEEIVVAFVVSDVVPVEVDAVVTVVGVVIVVSVVLVVDV